jgi:DNA ligase-1
MQRRDLLSRFSLGYLSCLAAAPSSASQPPALWLASPYTGNENLTDYWVSEKYDGIRGYWDGRQLLSRSGKALNPPVWFVQDWPSSPFEGEFWAGRGQFEKAASVFQQKQAPDEAWQLMQFMVFDVPSPNQTFTERITLYQTEVKKIDKPWVQAVSQSQIQSHAALKDLLQQTVQAGSEGLVLHRGSSLYQSGRTGDVLKVKIHEDAEAKVVGHEAGQGKYAQHLGALWVETPQGLRFKLASGLTDAQRKNPPPVGQWVTYRYRGLTDKGVPRFASFVRTRPAVER